MPPGQRPIQHSESDHSRRLGHLPRGGQRQPHHPPDLQCRSRHHGRRPCGYLRQRQWRGHHGPLQQSSGIAATADGLNVYVADTANQLIRRNTLYNTLIPLADRVDGLRFYLWDGTARRLLTSADGGASFSSVATGMNTAFAGFRTVPGLNGHLWVRAGASGLFRSTNFGANFTKLSSVAEVYQFDFGKAKPGSTHPAVFIWGKVGTTVGFFRSDDIGATWIRLNDNLRQFGYQNDIAGDPRVYGRVYLATSGRGVVVGEIRNPTAPVSQPSQMVYADSLENGWSDVSPSGTSLTSSDPVRRGTSAILIAAGTGKGSRSQETPARWKASPRWRSG